MHEAVYRELAVVTPADARVVQLRTRLGWRGIKGLVRSTAEEVFVLARAGASGFRLAGRPRRWRPVC